MTRLKALLAATDPRDVSGIAGVALITAGAYLVYRPAGLIVLGAALLAFAILASRKG